MAHLNVGMKHDQNDGVSKLEFPAETDLEGYNDPGTGGTQAIQENSAKMVDELQHCSSVLHDIISLCKEYT